MVMDVLRSGAALRRHIVETITRSSKNVGKLEGGALASSTTRWTKGKERAFK